MKTVGIITHYYNNSNYGGLLQSYALCEYLNGIGCTAEQICYSMNAKNVISTSQTNESNYAFSTLEKVINRTARKIIEKRKETIRSFRESIPHSKRIYDANTIIDIKNDYDILISGSDQIWNPSWAESGHFLAFPSASKKVSYAASIGTDNLSEEYLKFIKKWLNEYRYVSVREKNDVELLNNHISNDVEWVVDPTLLLCKEQWNVILPKSDREKDYVLSYFLGGSKENRQMACRYARKEKIDHYGLMLGDNCLYKSDLNLQTKKIWNADPLQFISLIKDAKIVFTDSFHGCVMAYIFNTPFIAFKREKNKMLGRITSFLDLIGRSDVLYDLNPGIIDYRTNEIENLQYNDENMRKQIQISKIFLDKVVNC